MIKLPDRFVGRPPRGRAVVLCTFDDWDGVYVDGKLVASTDSLSAHYLVSLLEQAGVIAEGLVTFEVARHALDEAITEEGQFPQELPGQEKTRS